MDIFWVLFEDCLINFGTVLRSFWGWFPDGFCPRFGDSLSNSVMKLVVEGRLRVRLRYMCLPDFCSYPFLIITPFATMCGGMEAVRGAVRPPGDAVALRQRPTPLQQLALGVGPWCCLAVVSQRSSFAVCFSIVFFASPTFQAQRIESRSPLHSEVRAGQMLLEPPLIPSALQHSLRQLGRFLLDTARHGSNSSRRPYPKDNAQLAQSPPRDKAHFD